MFTDITQQFNHIAQRIKDSEVILDPWPHMFITELFTPDYYRNVCEFEQFEQLELSEENGRQQYTFNQYHEQYTEFTSKIFSLLSDKFGYSTQSSVPATTNFWVDTDTLEINDIHIDAFFDTPFTISGQVYLPKDMEQRQYGTALYKYIGNNLLDDAMQDEGTAHPHIAKPECVDKFQLVRRVPFYPNCMFVTTNNKDSWHQAPCISRGDVRKSLMWRWKV